MARKLEVQIVGDASSLNRALGQAGSSSGKLGSTLGKGLRLAALGAGAALGGLAVAAKIGFDEFSDAQKVTAQTNAVIKSTGKAAKVTTKEVQGLSEALMKKSGVDDEVVQSGANMLLTFTSIRNEVGKGNDIFTQATKTTLDMSVALGKDMPQAAMLVGKALNDPIKGLTALRRVGVKFTDAQEAQIKKMVEAGDVMGAQKLILRELNREFGGSAKALGDTLPGKISIWKESFKNALGEMTAKFITFAGKIADANSTGLKIRILLTGVKNLADDLRLALKKVLFGSTSSKPIKTSIGRIVEFEKTRDPGLIAAMSAAFNNADWSLIGLKIGTGISKAVKFTDDMWTRFQEFVNSHMDEAAAMGATLAAKIVKTLLDPGFWVKNWDVVLAVALTAMPVGRLAKVGSTLAQLILAPFKRLIPEGVHFAALLAVEFFEKTLARLPGVVQTAARLMVEKLAVLLGWLKVVFKAGIDLIPGWLQKAFKMTFLAGVLSTLKDWLGSVKDAAKNAADWITKQFGRISGPLSDAVNFARKLWDWLNKLTHPWTFAVHIDWPSPPSWLSALVPNFGGGGGSGQPSGGGRGSQAPGANPRTSSISPRGMSSNGGVSVNFNGPVYGDPRSIAQAVREEFVKMQRNGSKLGFT